MAPITEPIADEKVYDNFFGRMAKALDPYTEAHPIGVMTSLMAIYSGYIGNGPRIATTGKTMPLGCWIILCGLSGKGRKGTATSLAIEVTKRAIPTFINSSIQYGFDSGLGVIQELHSRINTDGGVGPDPLVIYEEELSKFQEQAKRDRRLGTTMTKLWDGATIQYKTGRDFFEIPHPHAAFIGHVQPKLFNGTRGSKDAAGGTWNRFLIFWVERSKTVNVFASNPDFEPTADAWAHDFRAAALFGAEVPRVRVSEKVAKIFERIHRPQVEALTSTSEEISEFAERAMAYLLRVASLFALADGVEWIQPKHFDSALALIRYSVDSLRYILSSNRTFSGRTTLATKVLAFVTDHGPCSYTKMTTHVGRGYEKNSYMAAILELEGEVTLYEMPQKGPGRPAWYLAITGKEPDGFKPLNITEVDPDDQGATAADATNHPNYRVSSDETVVEAEVVEAEIVDEPEPVREPSKALAIPVRRKPAAAASKAATEAPKAPQAPAPGRNGQKVTPGRPKASTPATDPSSWF